MGERGFRIKGDSNKEAWEEADFPIACETCLGDNPYVRMTRESFAKACKICERPFTNFRWKAGTKGRHKTTQVCQSCAKIKNVCQVCIFDLEYGLPVQLRDQYLQEQDRIAVPHSDANKQHFTDQLLRQAESDGLPYSKSEPNEALLRLARRAPYYRRNLPHKCSFYAKGECSRGDECPYLHEMPTDKDDPLANQKIRDRYYGQNDPLAAKYNARLSAVSTLVAPEDESITTLWVGGMEPSITQEDLRDTFYHFGEIATIRIVPRQRCAFVEFTTRSAAEAAASKLFNNLNIKDTRLKLTWASRSGDAPATGDGGSSSLLGGGLPSYGASAIGGAAFTFAVPDSDAAAEMPVPIGHSDDARVSTTSGDKGSNSLSVEAGDVVGQSAAGPFVVPFSYAQHLQPRPGVLNDSAGSSGYGPVRNQRTQNQNPLNLGASHPYHRPIAPGYLPTAGGRGMGSYYPSMDPQRLGSRMSQT